MNGFAASPLTLSGRAAISNGSEASNFFLVPKGRGNDSYRYWLPGIEDQWRRDPYYLEDLPDLEPLVFDPDAEGGISTEVEGGARGGKS